MHSTLSFGAALPPQYTVAHTASHAAFSDFTVSDLQLLEQRAHSSSLLADTSAFTSAKTSNKLLADAKATKHTSRMNSFMLYFDKLYCSSYCSLCQYPNIHVQLRMCDYMDCKKRSFALKLL
jgi:hypothetical protein